MGNSDNNPKSLYYFYVPTEVVNDTLTKTFVSQQFLLLSGRGHGCWEDWARLHESLEEFLAWLELHKCQFFSSPFVSIYSSFFVKINLNQLWSSKGEMIILLDDASFKKIEANRKETSQNESWK